MLTCGEVLPLWVVMSKTAKARFEAKYLAEPNSGCWLWTAALERYGYFKLDGKQISAHRASFIIYVGPIPENLFVLHQCDNPPCVNPNHLFLGTHQDNVDDMMRKGRHGTAISGISKAKRKRIKDQVAAGTHCRKEHRRTQFNTYVSPNGTRTCITCRDLRLETYKRASA